MSFISAKEFKPLGPLPKGERILWQGRPQWGGLALRAFHVRKVLIYFALLALWRIGDDVVAHDGLHTIVSMLWLLLPCGVACAVLLLLAWLSSRTTQYTITSRRIVMQFGVALPITLNIPFGVIGAAGLRTFADGTGDISLAITGKDRLAYLMLWPHVRPWRANRTEPNPCCAPSLMPVEFPRFSRGLLSARQILEWSKPRSATTPRHAARLPPLRRRKVRGRQ